MFFPSPFCPAKQSATFPTFPVGDLRASPPPINKNISSLNSLMASLPGLNPSGAGVSFGFVKILIPDNVCLSNSLFPRLDG